MRRCINLFRCYYLCSKSTNCLSKNCLSKNCLSTNCLCEHARARACDRAPTSAYAHIVHPVFCLNADGLRQVNVSMRTEPGGRALNS